LILGIILGMTLKMKKKMNVPLLFMVCEVLKRKISRGLRVGRSPTLPRNFEAAHASLMEDYVDGNVFI
jgi:hypothetical protein